MNISNLTIQQRQKQALNLGRMLICAMFKIRSRVILLIACTTADVVTENQDMKTQAKVMNDMKTQPKVSPQNSLMDPVEIGTTMVIVLMLIHASFHMRKSVASKKTVAMGLTFASFSTLKARSRKTVF